ncbi:hypothetical protein D3C86_2164760 [compost metagenome]
MIENVLSMSLGIFFHKVIVNSCFVIPVVITQIIDFTFIGVIYASINKCYEINVTRIKLPRNETSVYPLVKIRADDGN